MRILFLVLVGVCILTSCTQNDPIKKPENTTVQFSLSTSSATNGRLAETPANVKSFLISIESPNGTAVVTRKKLALYHFGNDVISEPISLIVGDYSLVEFFVLDENDNIIYATPKAGSKLAYLVSKPLPINFQAVKDQTTKIIPEVVSVTENNAQDFGYATFSFDIVKTIDVLLSVFVYDTNTHNFKLTTADVIISDSLTTLYNNNVSDSTNTISVKDGSEIYTVTVTKPGYKKYISTFTAEEFKAFQTKPLIVILLSGLDLGENLIASYPFNGNAKDVSGHNLNGTVVGAYLAHDRNGNDGSAYYFDGNSYIEVANDSLLNFDNNFTFCAWIYMDDAKSMGMRIIDKQVGSSNYGFLLDTYDTNLTGRKIRFAVGEGWKYRSNTLLALQNWYFIVASYKDGVGKIYLNGELNMQYSSSTVTKIVKSTTPMRFGFDTGVRIGPDFDDSFVGMIDDIRIYGRVLSEEEVKYLYVN